LFYLVPRKVLKHVLDQDVVLHVQVLDNERHQQRSQHVKVDLGRVHLAKNSIMTTGRKEKKNGYLDFKLLGKLHRLEELGLLVLEAHVLLSANALFVVQSG